jgi:gamma-glutamyl-gamma-aminobutyrate hydrolase PuuD
MLSEEELFVLDGLLHSELAESRQELRHTDDRNYREQVRHRICLEEGILRKISSTSEQFSWDSDEAALKP